MKKNIITSAALVLSLCLTTAIAPEAVAQKGKGHAKQEATVETKSKQEEARERRGQQHKPNRLKDVAEKHRAEANAKAKGDQEKGRKAEDADQEGNGHAYGKNKGELSGREFGQARAAAAKQTGEEKRAELKKAVTAGDNKVTEARGRLSRAIEELERKRKAGTITDAEYNEKQATISRTEKAIQVLAEKVNAAKVLVSAPVVE